MVCSLNVCQHKNGDLFKLLRVYNALSYGVYIQDITKIYKKLKDM